MKRTIMLPSLFVLNSFLVGMPKASNAGIVSQVSDKNVDSVSTSYSFCDNMNINNSGAPIFSNEYVKFYKLDSLSLKPKFLEEPDLKYNVFSVGKDVKYVLSDGSGFIRCNGSRTWRNMNPGAIRYGDFTKQYGACGKAGGFAVFPTEEDGMKALKGLLKSDGYCNLTLASAVSKWAPPFENNTRAYQKHMYKMTGVPLNKKLNQLSDEELDKVANAIKFLEGWKEGKEEFFNPSNTYSMTKPNVKDMVIANNLMQRQYHS